MATEARTPFDVWWYAHHIHVSNLNSLRLAREAWNAATERAMTIAGSTGYTFCDRVAEAIGDGNRNPT